LPHPANPKGFLTSSPQMACPSGFENSASCVMRQIIFVAEAIQQIIHLLIQIRPWQIYQPAFFAVPCFLAFTGFRPRAHHVDRSFSKSFLV
jgi:hypothetical protein